MGDRQRALERLQSVAGSGVDLVSLWRAVTPHLATAVPHFGGPCFFTVDPSSLLTTSPFQEGLPEIPAEWLGREYVESDYNSMTDVLGSETGVGTLHDATGGRPETARKFHEEMAPLGCDQELLFALRTRDGETWGLIGLYRLVGQPFFDDRDREFVRAAAPHLAEGARHGLLLGQAEEPDLPEAPGLVVLNHSLGVESATPGVESWLAELGGSIEALPVSVLAAAGHVVQGRPGPAVSRVPCPSGRWLVLHSAPLGREDGADHVAVILEPAHPERLAPLLMRAYHLSPREQDVTQLALRGFSTAEVSRELAIAETTVQQHLKSIFDKTGVRSRRELVGRVFHAYYEPRVRDNESRTRVDRPSRHGPMPERVG